MPSQLEQSTQTPETDNSTYFYDCRKVDFEKFIDLAIHCTTLPESYKDSKEAKFIFDQIVNIYYIFSISFGFDFVRVFFTYIISNLYILVNIEINSNTSEFNDLGLENNDNYDWSCESQTHFRLVRMLTLFELFSLTHIKSNTITLSTKYFVDDFVITLKYFSPNDQDDEDQEDQEDDQEGQLLNYESDIEEAKELAFEGIYSFVKLTLEPLFKRYPLFKLFTTVYFSYLKNSIENIQILDLNTIAINFQVLANIINPDYVFNDDFDEEKLSGKPIEEFDIIENFNEELIDGKYFYGYHSFDSSYSDDDENDDDDDENDDDEDEDDLQEPQIEDNRSMISDSQEPVVEDFDSESDDDDDQEPPDYHYDIIS
tara:strand:- start:1532 stop:2644 length:1113 start_codon:yes stop_codon:yes gene_type:complete